MQLVLGNALLNLHCYGKAVEAFKQGAKYKASAVNVMQWLNYARAEGERVACGGGEVGGVRGLVSNILMTA